MKHVSIALLSLFVGACTVGEDFAYDNVPEEPALTTEEIQTLPDGLESEHHADLEAAFSTETPLDDAATFDTDEVTGIIDEAVTDTDGPTGTASFQPLLRSGLHPRASDALRAAGVASWRITQTIGSAAASAGTHARDGYVNGAPYSAATDLSTRDLTNTQIVNLLERLAKLGFVAWYRHGGFDGWNGVNHMHIVYANAKMKASLRSQVRSFLAGRNGLVSNTIYRFHTFSAAAKATVKGKYAMSNLGTSNGGAGVSGRVSTAGANLTVRAGASKSSTAVSSVANGSYVTITCQKHGESMTGTYGTTTLWDRVAGGYVTDAYISTGSDGQVAPTCN